MQIKLSHPVMSDGTELRVLDLRRPKVRDVLLAAKIGGTDEEKEIRVLANLCEVAPDVVEDLDKEGFKGSMRNGAALMRSSFHPSKEGFKAGSTRTGGRGRRPFPSL